MHTEMLKALAIESNAVTHERTLQPNQLSWISRLRQVNAAV